VDITKRKDFVFVILAGFFITNAIVAELIGGKVVQFFGLFTQSVGIILWPVVFLLTDIINEYYGPKGVRRLTYITVGLIAYTFILITIAIRVNSIPDMPITDEVFQTVFGQSQWIIVGSITAFFVSQLVDVYFFCVFRTMTKGKMIWLRATASTVISQFFDTFIVQFIAFVLPKKWTWEQFLERASMGYLFKLLVALALIPVIYFLHNLIHKYIKTAEEEGIKD
jgi:uncharacterized integral membrane protein (TIGR00697 family)